MRQPSGWVLTLIYKHLNRSLIALLRVDSVVIMESSV